MVEEAVGQALVRQARAAIAEALGAPADRRSRPARLEIAGEPRGVFVTLRRHPSGALRGCIGFPLPRDPLEVAVARAAVAAALEDPRFPPVRLAELDRLTVEISVLTPPAPVPPEQRPTGIRAGLDGLIVETDRTSGLLLPQVATEMGWDATELLDGTCEKAGLSPGAWRDPRVRVLRFQADVFGESAPAGPVLRAAAPPSTGRGGARPAPRT